LLNPDVKRIFQQIFIVGADVDRHRQAGRGMNAGADRVKSQFANGNPHAICAQIAKAKNAFAVGDHNHPNCSGSPIL
jgi:hypothetical protein